VDCWPSEALLTSLRGSPGRKRDAAAAAKAKDKRASGDD
jgi:hypothetical protein